MPPKSDRFKLDKNHFYLTVDAAVFTILDKRLKILLVKRKYSPFAGKFALPGGFVMIEESLEDAAARELQEETGVEGIYLKKLPSFGDVGRDQERRIITVPFLALIDGEEVKLHATGDASLQNGTTLMTCLSLHLTISGFLRQL
jgi:8-oxo-dGTP diphosphatase